MSPMLEVVRQPLLEEALKSPALLSDLAGLEHYIAESYDSRSFVELLQNADDAGASRFVVQRAGGFCLSLMMDENSLKRISRAFVEARLLPSIEDRESVIVVLDSNRYR
jgi:hypothetical protein